MVPPPLLASWPPFPGGGGTEAYLSSNGTAGDGGGDGGSDDPGSDLANWSSLIGIVTAIVGNMLIALALNVQRYAHIRLSQQRQRNRELARQVMKSLQNERNAQAGGQSRGGPNGQNGGNGTSGRLSAQQGRPSYTYGAVHHHNDDEEGQQGWLSRSTRSDEYHDNTYDEDDEDYNDHFENDPLAASYNSDLSASQPSSSSSNYLRSPYWWLGQVLITVGEMGNFLAYGFAPASIVSPLGVVALISNCVIAPILFKERFRMRDFGGVIVAIAGAVTVVLSAKQQETKLAPHDVWDAITTPAFEIYVAITCSLIALLMWASPRYGNRTILIDLGLVGLFGAYTVLATKGVSSMLSSTLFGAFTTPVTYVLFFILLATAVMQVRYVNKALQRFDSTQVIPIQFVMFTLNVIIGSAVLYRDFERTTAEQAVKFVGGCLLTFFGVFIITSGRPPAEGDESDLDEDMYAQVEGERINLAEQARLLDEPTSSGSAPGTPGTPTTPSTPRASGTPGLSRRSSRASHVSFAHARSQQLAALAGDGVPSPRSPLPNTAASSSSHIPTISTPSGNEDEYADDDDDNIASGDASASPLLENPWRGSANTSTSLGTNLAPTSPSKSSNLTVRPGLGPSAFSADSVLLPTTPRPQREPRDRDARERERERDHFQSLFSPSPLLSSTVSTVVADTILKHMDNGAGSSGGMGGAGGVGGSSSLHGVHPGSRRPSTRRVRPGLRSSLFVPQDELGESRQYQHHISAKSKSASTEALVSASENPFSGAIGAISGREGGEDELLLQNQQQQQNQQQAVQQRPGLRDRARSLSTTLGGLLLWPRRSRRNTSPSETGRALDFDSNASMTGQDSSRQQVPGPSSVPDYDSHDDVPPGPRSRTE